MSSHEDIANAKSYDEVFALYNDAWSDGTKRLFHARLWDFMTDLVDPELCRKNAERARL
jgi:hypothetical protein